MRKLMVRIFFGECFLIFCNIFIASTEEDHTTIWEKESPNDFNITYFQDTVVVSLDKEMREFIGNPEEDIKRFLYHHKGNESQSIGFIISPCKTAEIQWVLKYKRENETSEVPDNNFQLETLAEYRGTELFIYVGKVRRGVYFLELWSTRQRLTYFLYVTMNPASVDLLLQVKENKHKRALTFKKNLKNSSLTFKWSEWSWKNEVVYVLTYNDKKYISSACELEIYPPGNTEIITTRNKTYDLFEEEIARPGETYYVSVFVKTKHDFLLPYLQGHVTIPKNNPVTLKDGVPIRKHLTPDDDKLTFRYKVRNRQFPGSENEILWYIISCVGPVQIEVNHQKNPVLKKQVITRYKAFKISEPNIGNRYVLKVTDSMGGFNSGKFDGSIEVFATMRPKLLPFPNVTNFGVQSFRNINYKVPNKISYTLAWNAAVDKQPTTYCVRVYSKKDGQDNNIWEINQCTNVKKKFSHIKGFITRNCTKTDESLIITRTIFDLDPMSDYAIYVSARKQGSKRRLWYNTLHIKGYDFYPYSD